jgi:hypothetical protein
MKKKRSIFSILLLLMLLGFQAHAQEYARDRHLRESFLAPQSAEIQVVNKYGDVHLIPWEKDSVVFEIAFSVTSNKQAKADKIYDYIDFEFKSTNYYIIAQTVFKGQNTFWTEMADVASTIFTGGTSTSIDYTVYFPAGNAIRVENKFGNIYTTEHPGKVNIMLSNGDLKAYAFLGETKLRLEFANASIDHISSGEVILSYTELDLEKAGTLRIESKSSKLYLGDIEDMSISSRRDRYSVKNAGTISGSSYFSYIDAGTLSQSISLTSTYGDLVVHGFLQGFRQADINAQYTDIAIGLAGGMGLHIVIERDDRTQVMYPAGIGDRKETLSDPANKITKVELTAGTATGIPALIHLNTRAGMVTFTGP